MVAKQVESERAAREKAETEAREARAAKQEQAEYDAAMRRSVEDELRRKRAAKGAGAPSTAIPAGAEQPPADAGEWQQVAPARGGKAKMVETRVTPSPPPPPQPTLLTAAPRKLLELMSLHTDVPVEGKPVEAHIRAMVAAQDAPFSEVIECVRRAGAGGVPLPDLKEQVTRMIGVFKHFGRGLKTGFFKCYLEGFPQHFRLTHEYPQVVHFLRGGRNLPAVVPAPACRRRRPETRSWRCRRRRPPPSPRRRRRAATAEEASRVQGGGGGAPGGRGLIPLGQLQIGTGDEGWPAGASGRVRATGGLRNFVTALGALIEIVPWSLRELPSACLRTRASSAFASCAARAPARRRLPSLTAKRLTCLSY